MRINRAIIVLSLIIINLSHFVYADDIKGTVSDKGSGDFVPGANVFLEGTNYGTSSDRAGNYTINGVPEGEYTLIVTYVGYSVYSNSASVGPAVFTHNVQISLSYLDWVAFN